MLVMQTRPYSKLANKKNQSIHGMCVLEKNTCSAILWAKVSVAYVNFDGEIYWVVIACG